jgi:hypothetical protein
VGVDDEPDKVVSFSSRKGQLHVLKGVESGDERSETMVHGKGQGGENYFLLVSKT